LISPARSRGRRIVERQRRLGEHRRQHRRLEHHGEREVSREAHADGPDAAAATLAVARRASAHSHCVTGLDWPAASARNSALTQLA
jgi:hypothetical protein